LLLVSSPDSERSIRESSSLVSGKEVVFLPVVGLGESDSRVLGSVSERSVDDVNVFGENFGRVGNITQVDDVGKSDSGFFVVLSVVRDDSHHLSGHLLDDLRFGDKFGQFRVSSEVLLSQRNEDGVLRDFDSFLDNNFFSREIDSVEVVDHSIGLDGESISRDRGVQRESREVSGESFVSGGEEVVHVLELGVVVSGDEVVALVPSGEHVCGVERRSDDYIMVGHDGVGLPGLVDGSGGFRDIRLFDVRHVFGVLRSLDFGEFVVRDVRSVDIRDGLLGDVDSLGVEVSVEFDVLANVVRFEGFGDIVFSVVLPSDTLRSNGLFYRNGDLIDQEIGSSGINEDGVFGGFYFITKALVAKSGVDSHGVGAQGFVVKSEASRGDEKEESERHSDRFHL